jgi:hyperosmotically inducible protein
MRATINFPITVALTSILLIVPLCARADDVLDKVGNSISTTANDAADTVSDSAITTAVKAALLVEPDIKSFKISVTTTNGVVALDGKVDTQLQANKAVEVAQSISGVKDVDDSKLAVKSSSNFIKDAFITAKVKGKIMQLSSDKKISGDNDLHVETTDGAVHIHGTVSDNSDIGAITDAIKAMKGVTSVHTNIEVKN